MEKKGATSAKSSKMGDNMTKTNDHHVHRVKLVILIAVTWNLDMQYVYVIYVSYGKSFPSIKTNRLKRFGTLRILRGPEAHNLLQTELKPRCTC